MLKKRFTSKNCVTCKRCMIECADRHSQAQNMFLSPLEKPAPVPRINISFRKDKPHATVCQNCAKPNLAKPEPKHVLMKMGKGDRYLNMFRFGPGCKMKTYGFQTLAKTKLFLR